MRNSLKTSTALVAVSLISAPAFAQAADAGTFDYTALSGAVLTAIGGALVALSAVMVLMFAPRVALAAFRWIKRSIG